MEEINKVSIKEMLYTIPDELTPIERIILANESTVQTLLSVLFKVPIEVEILRQMSKENGTFIRWSRLCANYSPVRKVTVCIAQSIIKSDNQIFLNEINKEKLGIGQVIASLGIITRRNILEFYSDENVFSRIYEIRDVGMTETGGHVNCLITEVFQKNAFGFDNKGVKL